MSRLIYLADAIGLPKHIEQSARKIYLDFLWGGKSRPVAIKTTSLLQEHGGIGMVDVGAFFKVRKVLILNRLLAEPVNTWKIIPRSYFQKMDKMFDTENFVMKCTDIRGLDLGKMPAFYQHALLCYAELNQNIKDTPQTTEER